jgi:hypothetical protein
MAFNPFHSFRKYKKTMFAVLTIICMFVFILSSGLGGGADLFNRRIFGGSRYPEVARLDGRKIDVEELKQVRNRRRMANEFMSMLITQSQSKTMADVQAKLDSFPPFVRSQVEQIIQGRLFMQFGQQYLYRYLGSIPTSVRALDAGAEMLERDKKPSEAELVRRLRRLLIQDQGRREYFGELYFGGTIRSGQDLLDFLVWKWAADQRNIQLSTEAVQRMMRDEVGSEDADEAAAAVVKYILGRDKGLSASALLDALGDEFRVRLAKTALIGETPKMPATIGGYVTPYEFFKFFRDVRTTIRVSMLPVSADAFLDKVTEKPTKKHRNEEWAPDKEQPGFKEGKKVKIEWVGMKAEPPLIKKAALEDAAKKTALANAISKAIMAPPADNFAGVLGRTGAFAIVEDPKLLDKRTDREYEMYLAREKSGSNWVYSALIFFGLHDRSVYQPHVIAAGIADLLGSSGTGGTLLSPTMTLGSQSVFQEMRERVRFGMLPFALGGQSVPQMLGVSDMMIPQPLPKKAVQSRLNEEVTSAIVTDFFRSELEQFQKTFADKAKDIKKPGTKLELEDHADEFVEKYGLAQGASKGFHDRYTLIDDPGLKPLKDKYLKNRATTDPKGMDFGTPFFNDDERFGNTNSSYRPQWFQGEPTAGFTKPEEEFFLAWKTEELEAKVRTFEEAKADVEKAWKRMKARELASKAAEDLQKQVRDKAVKNLATLNDFAAQNKITPVEVGPFALRNETPTGRSTMYRFPEVTRDKVTFPTPEFAMKLMDLRDKPIGDTMVLPDQPKDNYYVAVLTEHTEPTDLAFQMVYARSGPDAILGSDPLLSEFEAERRIKTREDIIKQLRVDAKLKPVDEELKRFAEKGGGSEE